MLGLFRRCNPDRGALTCASCRFFDADPARLEQAIPGLTSMGSAYAAVRSDDGLCLRHDRYLGSRSHCPEHMPGE